MNEFEDQRKEFQEILEFTENKKNMILDNLISKNIDSFIKKEDAVDVTNEIYKDTTIDTLIETLPVLEGSKKIIKHLIRNPITNKEKLIDRQSSYIEDDIDFSTLKEHEDDILWIYKLNEEINNNNSINLLFPNYFIISYINYITPLLDMFHLYKIAFIPLSSLLFPLISLFTPLYYVNKYLNFNISIKGYIETLYKFIKVMFKPTGNIKVDIIKSITFIVYIFLFLYNMYQTFEFSLILYKTRKSLIDKMTGLVTFIKEASYIINSTQSAHPNILTPFMDINSTNTNDLEITNSMTDIYRIWKSDDLKDKVTSILLKIYTIDVIKSISKLKDDNYVNVNYLGETKIWNAKNPLLLDTQSANPVNLSKNIIITGPNAAGKTTYVKSILSNVILSQTFGIAYALKAEMIIYDTINSFMRITDVLGLKSYFESEAEYCLNMINNAIELNKNNKKGLFLMDEPMHSTPPTEGMATAYAVTEFIGKLQGIDIILTTHFHKLTLLEKEYPNNFINLSVEAIPKQSPESGFIFPYKIKKGHSYQCIALELLKSKDYPEEVLTSAINMKNKIYEEINK